MNVEQYVQRYRIGNLSLMNWYIVDKATGKVSMSTYEERPYGSPRLICKGPTFDLSGPRHKEEYPEPAPMSAERCPRENDLPDRKWIVTDITKKYDPQVIVAPTYQDTAENYIHRILELSLPSTIKIEPAHPCQYGEECPVDMCCGECYQKFVKNAGLQKAYYMNRDGATYVAIEERDHL